MTPEETETIGEINPQPSTVCTIPQEKREPRQNRKERRARKALLRKKIKQATLIKHTSKT